MMKDSPAARGDLIEQVHDLFRSQSLAVLSTQDSGQPYCNLVAFAARDDLKRLCFATTRATRKYANLTRDARVSMLIDNRGNREADFHAAMAVTVLGRAAQIEGREREELLILYVTKHPYLEDFVKAPSCALIAVWPRQYFIVRRFQEVLVLRMEP